MTVAGGAYAQSLTEQAGEGDAHRPGDDPAVVVRARRPAAPRDLHADRAGDPRRGRGPRARRRGDRSRSTRRRCARACRCAAPSRTSTCAGRSTASGCHRAAARRRPRSTRTCATRSSARSSSTSPRLDADVISIEASRSDMELLDAFARRSTTRARSGPGVYDIHSPRVPSRRGDRAAARAGRGARSAATGCGSTPTAGSRRAAGRRRAPRSSTSSRPRAGAGPRR